MTSKHIGSLSASQLKSDSSVFGVELSCRSRGTTAKLPLNYKIMVAQYMNMSKKLDLHFVKKYLIACANRDNTDQPAHPCCPINVFPVCICNL